MSEERHTDTAGDDADMTGMPIHVRVKQRQAVEAEQQQVEAASVRPSEAAAVPPAADAVPPATGEEAAHVVASPDGEKQITVAQSEYEALKAEVTALKFVNQKQKERLNTGYGRQRAVNERLQREKDELAAQVAELAKRKPDASAGAETDEDVLRRAQWTQEEIDELTPTQIKREARKERERETEKRAMEQRLAELNGKVAGKDAGDSAAARASALDAAIEAKFPGLLKSIRRGGDADVDWSIFREEVNPDSDENLTNGECYDLARKVGNRGSALAIIERFATDNGLTAQAVGSAPGGEHVVDVGNRNLMPAAGPAVTPSASARNNADADEKPTFKQTYVDAFMAKFALHQGSAFRPFAVSAGGVQKVFRTLKDAEKEDAAINDAWDDSRVDLRG